MNNIDAGPVANRRAHSSPVNITSLYVHAEQRIHERQYVTVTSTSIFTNGSTFTTQSHRWSIHTPYCEGQQTWISETYKRPAFYTRSSSFSIKTPHPTNTNRQSYNAHNIKNPHPTLPNRTMPGPVPQNGLCRFLGCTQHAQPQQESCPNCGRGFCRRHLPLHVCPNRPRAPRRSASSPARPAGDAGGVDVRDNVLVSATMGRASSLRVSAHC